MERGNHHRTKGIIIPLLALAAILSQRCNPAERYYRASDFALAPKTDVHLHYVTMNQCYLRLAKSLRMRIVTPNVDAGEPLDEQLKIAAFQHSQYPATIAFLGTFAVDSFGTPGFVERTKARIDECMKAGASGMKIWKNIGMVLRDKNGKYVMADDPAFDPIYRYMEDNHIRMMAHLGEPKNCWQPFDQMTDSGNYRYYKSHPQYHMYLHPEAPSYEDQINARDNLVRKHPKLDFTGAHLGSLEWSVDEIAKRFEQYPNMCVDLSARIAFLQYQSVADHDKVRNFMIKYKDRIMYGTDITLTDDRGDTARVMKMLADKWRSNWIYLATDSVLHIKDIAGDVKGLRLPAEVTDKIMNGNAGKFFSAAK